MSANIPYAFVAGGVTFTGMIYLRDPIEDSYVDGYFAGSVVGNYHLSKSDYEACAVSAVRACINFDPDVRRKLFVLFCTPKVEGFPPTVGWDCGEWIEIASW